MDFFDKWRDDLNKWMAGIPHSITLPEGRIGEVPAFCTTCGDFLYWRFDENQWAHVRDIREQDKESR